MRVHAMRLIVAMAIGVAPIAAMSQDPRPCELFSAAEVTSVTGTAPGRGQAEGPDAKEFPGATTWTCVWIAGDRVFATRVLVFASAVEATRAMTSDATYLKGFPDGMQLAPVSGLGEQAMWGSSPDEGALWIVRKGKTMMSVFLGGEIKKPDSQREPLRKLAASGIAKLR